jgi:hypothetical protein
MGLGWGQAQKQKRNVICKEITNTSEEFWDTGILINFYFDLDTSVSPTKYRHYVN